MWSSMSNNNVDILYRHRLSMYLCYGITAKMYVHVYTQYVYSMLTSISGICMSLIPTCGVIHCISGICMSFIPTYGVIYLVYACLLFHHAVLYIWYMHVFYSNMRCFISGICMSLIPPCGVLYGPYPVWVFYAVFHYLVYFTCRYSMGLIPTRKSLALCEKVNTSHFCR